jgi:hypothetical protein
MTEALTADPNQQAVGYYDAGSVICYDNINMSGVRSIDFLMAKEGAAGRFAILVGGNSLSNGTNLGEKITNATGGWNTYQLVKVGLSSQVTGNQTLCFLGLLGGGIFNLDKFTLSDVAGQNDGISADPDDGPVGGTDLPKITTQGNKVLFGGQSQSIAGMSLFWSNDAWGGDKYYNADVVRWLKQDWNIKLIRAAMGAGTEEGGYILSPDSNKNRTKVVVNAAIENGLYVIIDWHSHNAEMHKSQAIAFFTEMAETYGAYNNVIYEVYNEPLQVSWTGTIKPYAQEVIAAIRAKDPDNLIIVGTPAWSQDVDVAAQSPISGSNIAYTLHFYAGTHKQFLRDKAISALNRGIPLFVTEWGTVNADGDGGVDQTETQAWMNFLKQNGISHANWSITDKVEGSAALVPGASISGGWNDSQLTASGRYVKSIIKSW